MFLLKIQAADEPAAREEKVRGGWNDRQLSVCTEIWNKYFAQNYFKNHSVVGCSSQVVGGMNYAIKLERKGDKIESCGFMVFKAPDGHVEIASQLEDDNGCSILFKKTFG